MSGHSKWHNIQGRKNAQDAKRGKIFQKLSRELFMAAKAGGPDPDGNPQLRLMMDKARSANMPKDNVKRAIQKASGDTDTNYEEVIYEGYGPGGVPVMVFALTDNKNRTASNVRVAFTRNGGTLGTSGSVNYLFDRKGYIVIEREGLDKDEDTVMLDALEAGVEDIQTSDDAFEMYVEPHELSDVKTALEEAGYVLANAESEMIPQNLTPVEGDKAEKLRGMIDALEEDDDVSEVYAAAELS